MMGILYSTKVAENMSYSRNTREPPSHGRHMEPVGQALQSRGRELTVSDWGAAWVEGRDSTWTRELMCRMHL